MWRGYDLPPTDWGWKLSGAYIHSNNDRQRCSTKGSTGSNRMLLQDSWLNQHVAKQIYTVLLHVENAVYSNISVDQEDSYIITRQIISTIFLINSKRRNLHICPMYNHSELINHLKKM